MFPGKQDFVTVRTNGQKEHIQKRLLLLNLRELYLQYKAKYPEDKIGFSKFCELRPKWCVTVNVPGAQSVCVCQQHQNVKLMISAIPGNHDYKEILQKLVCSISNRDCMLHMCEACPGRDAVEDFIRELFSANDFDEDDQINYKKWIHTDRTTLESVTATVEEFISAAGSAFDKLRQHHFISKEQSRFITERKEELSNKEAIVLLDFAENYSFLVQDAVQGVHWDNTQATLHPLLSTIVRIRSWIVLVCA